MAASTLQMLDSPKWSSDASTSAGTPRSLSSRRPPSSPNAMNSPSVASSDTATAASVFITLWNRGMCLSPIPWMLCSPKPL